MKCPYAKKQEHICSECHNSMFYYTECRKRVTEPMTNEEWFDDLSTEEKAEFLSKIEEQYPCGSLLKCDVTCGYHSQCRSDDVAPTNKEAWVEWLKQPHREENEK